MKGGNKHMETKICSRCGRELPIEQFVWRDKKKGTRRSHCKECHSNYMKERYYSKKNEIYSFKKQCKCEKCGYDKCPEALDFHHIDPNEKEGQIARMITSSYGLDKVKDEIKKCIVLCANCHREFHYYEKYNQITLEEFLNE